MEQDLDKILDDENIDAQTKQDIVLYRIKKNIRSIKRDILIGYAAIALGVAALYYFTTKTPETKQPVVQKEYKK